MTDKLLSAEKVKALIDAFIKDHEQIPKNPKYEDAIRNGYVVGILSKFMDVINSGQLDADRPECPKCGGTRVVRGCQGEHPCDCIFGK